MKRQKFIGSICPLLLASMMASPVLLSCSKEEVPPEPLSEEEENYLKFKELIGAQGSYTEGKKLYIDLSHQRYEAVKLVGDFVNDLDNGLLILRKDEENYLAFDNCCPHLGSRNLWTFSNNKFRCSNHGNSFGIGGGFTAFCSSNNRSGNLKQYGIALYKDLLTVDFNA